MGCEGLNEKIWLISDCTTIVVQVGFQRNRPIEPIFCGIKAVCYIIRLLTLPVLFAFIGEEEFIEQYGYA